MDITINEFARRICEANHTIHDTNPMRAIPCPEHLQIARQSWGLIQPSGSKTLGAILTVVIADGRLPDNVAGITQINPNRASFGEAAFEVRGHIRESHMEGGVRVIDRIDVEGVDMVNAAEVRHEQLLHGVPNAEVPHG